jgi:signal transduction histidine kinase
MWDRLAVRLTAGFLLAALIGVMLVAVLAYRSTTEEFGSFVGHMRMMQQMMGDPGFAEAQRDFLDNLGRTLWIAGASGLAAALILGGLFTRHIVAPLSRVASAARGVARGNLEEKVAVRGAGELAELGDSFNAMAESLRHDRDLRRNMVADIAHELRTPLTVLQGNTEAMLDGVLTPDRENLESLHQETLLLTRLVEDLRTLSLAEAGVSWRCGRERPI